MSGRGRREPWPRYVVVTRAGPGGSRLIPLECPHGSELRLEGSSEEPSPWDSVLGRCPQACPDAHRDTACWVDRLRAWW